MISFPTDIKIALRLSEKKWYQNYNDSNLSQNLYYSTDLKAN